MFVRLRTSWWQCRNDISCNPNCYCSSRNYIGPQPWSIGLCSNFSSCFPAPLFINMHQSEQWMNSKPIYLYKTYLGNRIESYNPEKPRYDFQKSHFTVCYLRGAHPNIFRLIFSFCRSFGANENNEWSSEWRHSHGVFYENVNYHAVWSIYQ